MHVGKIHAKSEPCCNVLTVGAGVGGVGMSVGEMDVGDSDVGNDVGDAEVGDADVGSDVGDADVGDGVDILRPHAPAHAQRKSRGGGTAQHSDVLFQRLSDPILEPAHARARFVVCGETVSFLPCCLASQKPDQSVPMLPPSLPRTQTHSPTQKTTVSGFPPGSSMERPERMRCVFSSTALRWPRLGSMWFHSPSSDWRRLHPRTSAWFATGPSK